MIKTYTLIVNYTDSRGYRVHKRFDNLSRVGVATIRDYYQNANYADLYWDVEL